MVYNTIVPVVFNYYYNIVQAVDFHKTLLDPPIISEKDDIVTTVFTVAIQGSNNVTVNLGNNIIVFINDSTTRSVNFFNKAGILVLLVRYDVVVIENVVGLDKADYLD